MAIQHRGQIFSGISTTACKKRIFSYKNQGLVSKVLNPRILKAYSGNVGIGHVGYALPKMSSIEDAQPYQFKTDLIDFSIAFNGTITNFEEIYERLSSMGRIFTGKSDIELIATLIETFFNLSDDTLEALRMVLKYVKGAYCIVVLESNGNLYAVRDPYGYKPLCYGSLRIDEKSFNIISSESCAIDSIGGKLEGDINPGEILFINPAEGLKKFQIIEQEECGLCQFEYIYVARPDSIIDGISIADVRYRLGRNLAQQDYIPSDNVIVVPVPDSGRSAAMGYAWESGILYQEGLMKNRYIWQLKQDPDERLNSISSIVKGKDIVLIDDSILSGTTIKKIVSMLRKVGAKSIHVRISCPPIINNCEMNHNFLDRKLLISHEMRLKNLFDFREKLNKEIGADSLRFQTTRGLLDAIGLEPNQICYTCLTDQIHEIKEDKNEELKLLI
jgi:amidophosphoribosyltransferase